MINAYHQRIFDEIRKKIGTKEAGYFVLACVDIEGFKIISEQYGADTANEILRHIKKCINECMEEVDGFSAHTMTDEFLLLYPSKYSDSKIFSKYYAKAVKPPCFDCRISLRIGKYRIDHPQEAPESMYYRAQLAADSICGNYERKSAVYSEELRSALIHRQQLVFNMNDALRKKEFELWLQPQCNHATGAIIGAEVLVRWNHEGKYISPAEFIGVFEETGFIYQMDKYVWENACILLRHWIDEGKMPLPLSVNVSRKDILHDDFLDTLTSLLEKYQISTELLRVEITESAFADVEGKVTEKVNELIHRGYIVEIDDFGSGDSSLNTLKDVPAPVLKLDMRFFEDTKNADRAGNIIESVVRMAKWLDMEVIAEGVEERSQADFLKSIGCYYIQGYYYAKPMPIKDFEAWAENRDKETSLNRIHAIENYDSSDFWNPESIETLIFNNYVGGAYVFEYRNGETELLRINDEYLQQFRGMILPNTDLRHMGVLNYLNDTEKRKFYKTMRDAAQSHREASCELEISDGVKTEYLRITMRVLAQTDNRSLFYAGVSNVTERHKAHRNEQIIAKQLQVILDHIQEGVITLALRDEKNIEIVYANDSFYHLHGFTKEQYKQEISFITDLILQEDRENAERKIAEIERCGGSTTFEYACRKRDGSVVQMQMTCSFIMMESIEKNLLLGVINDITDKREGELHGTHQTRGAADDSGCSE